MAGIKKLISETAYRLKFRKEIQNSTDELLRITYDEVKKEIERRNKRK